MSVDVQSLARAVAEIAASGTPDDAVKTAEAAADMLANEGRTRDLRAFPQLVRKMLRRYGPLTVEIEVPTALQPAELAQLEKALASALGRDITLDVRENPALIGGARLRVGDERFDSSIRGALDRISTLFTPAA